MMNSKDFKKHREDFFDLAMSVSDKKRVEYCISNHDEDVLYNFKYVADRLGITAEQALMVYVLKHVDAICNDAKTGVQVSDETVMSRAIDVCNYMILYTSLKKEPHENNTKPDGAVDGVHERSGSPSTEPQKWDEYSSQEA